MAPPSQRYVITTPNKSLDIKQEMLKRCYAPNAQGDRKKKVRFWETKTKPKPREIEDDHISVKSSRSERITMRSTFDRNFRQTVQLGTRSPSNRSLSRQGRNDTSIEQYSDSRPQLIAISQDEDTLSRENPREGVELDNNRTRDESISFSEERG